MTREEIDQAAKLYEDDGYTIAEVQAALGLTYQAARYRLIKAGVTLRSPSERGNDRRAAAMRAFWKKPGVRERMIDVLSAAHPFAWTEDEDRRLLELKAAKVPDRIIAKRLGSRSHESVRTRLKLLRKRAREAS
jgi:hypothetical protein